MLSVSLEELSMFSDYTKNFLIYCNNLSVYYVVSVVISIGAIVLTWMFNFYNGNKLYVKSPNETQNQEYGNNTCDEMENIILTYKKDRKQKMKDVTYALTEDQLEDERRVEQEQLSAILQLLKEQEDKFQVGSMEELEGQLRLYR